ncbi:MAG: cell envelope integrity protein TolA [Nitrosomonadales bacterium]|nr:cell envelope integrity protein TolA [Nitrosomonadales bacterium]
MSTALTYQEPYRFSAGMLALTVHLLFFFVLYFGFRWQAQPPEEFMVEMWESLPDAEVAPERQPPPPVQVEPKPLPKVVAPVLPPLKADIEIRDKKKKQTEEKAKAVAVVKAKQEKELRELEAYSERLRHSEQARIRAEVDAATATQVGKYQDKIRAKIRSKIVKQDVPPTAEATFEVTLLPGGEVMDAELIKSSGYAAYDDAVERAIRRASPLPIPSEISLQRMFRKLKLTFRPE